MEASAKLSPRLRVAMSPARTVAPASCHNRRGGAVHFHYVAGSLGRAARRKKSWYAACTRACFMAIVDVAIVLGGLLLAAWLFDGQAS
jgi:hypothetical protein